MHRVVAATVLSIFLLAFAINRFLPAPEASAGSGGSSTNYTLTVQFQGTGTVHINPPNVNRTSNSTFTYAQNTVVNLSASAPAGWRFLRWENALTGSSPSGSVAMTSNKTVKAVFVQCKITVNKQGEGQVRIEPPDETLTPTFTKTYSGITTVTLTAIPATGWAFKEWTGDHAGTGNPATFEVDREETVTAVFEQIKLTVNKTGEGQVSATPPGGAQTPTFTEYYGTNTTVSLTAIPEPGWAFKEWTGAISSTSNPASVLVNGDKTVRAVFEEIKLTVEKSGDGQVNVDPPDTTALPTFTEEYTGATEVTLTAMPDPGWAFVEWTGDLTGTDNPSTLLVDGEKEVRAVFEERKLTVSKEGEGQVSASPPGGAQTPTFTESYGVDTEVTLTAHPATGWAFKEWTGDVTGTDNPATITVNRDRSVTAVFIQIELNVAKTGEGQVWTNGAVGGLRTPPFTESYLPGAQATIVAVPATGWGFKEWTGDKTGTSDTLSFTINESTSITAVFEQVSLGVTKSGSGQVHVDPPDETLTPPFTEGYPINAAVSLTAIPDAGWIFKGWSGDEVTPTNPLSITMSDDKSLIAVFDQRKLVLSRVGSGTATLNPPNVTPNSYPHTEYYSSNATVTLSATPGTGWAFKHWSILGNVVTQNPTSVLVDQHVSATVVFEEIELRVDKEGEGIVGVDPPGGAQTLPYTEAYTGGTTVTLSADPEDGWGFQEWEGDVPEGMENNNPLALTMDKARDVTAVFVPCRTFDLLFKTFISVNYFGSGLDCMTLFPYSTQAIIGGGDDRTFSSDANTSYRTRLTAALSPNSFCGTTSYGGVAHVTGISDVYTQDALIAWNISPAAKADTTLGDCTLKICSQAGTINSTWIGNAITPTVYRYRFVADATAGCTSFFPVASIDYDLELQLDVTDPDTTYWRLSGSHDAFPWYEFYLNTDAGLKTIYLFQPLQNAPAGLAGLLVYGEINGTSGQINH